MHIHGIHPSANSLDLDRRPAAQPVDAKANSDTMEHDDLRFIRRQVITMQRSLWSLSDLVHHLSFVSSEVSSPDGRNTIRLHAPESPDPDQVREAIRERASDFRDALRAVISDDQLLGKPGPILEVLRDNLRATVKSVFNRPIPNSGPPLYRPTALQLDSHRRTDEEGHVEIDDASEPDWVSFLLDLPEEQLVEAIFLSEHRDGQDASGHVEEFHAALRQADEALANRVGDQGVFLDRLA